MSQISIADLVARVGSIELLSTDVFDTLLLRTSRSERSRIALGERAFASALALRGVHVDPDLLVGARMEAQHVAFRALNVGGAGEVNLLDLIGRQLKLLGLPADLAEQRLQIELEVEKSSLVANESLAEILRAHRQAGTRIVAVSDTTLPASALRTLIEHFHGPELIHQVYSSADHGKTKRRGDLFALVAELEGIPPERTVHLGDDYAADVKAALANGLTAHHATREPYRGRVRKLDGAVTEARRVLRLHARTRAAGSYEDAWSFGRAVLGPVTAHFCQLIWLYTAQAATTHDPVLLFCARGGIGIRSAYELLVDKLQLPSVRRETVMISRLVAARAALIGQSPAAAQELEREFRSGTLADAAHALGSKQYELGPEWQHAFTGDAFMQLLFAPSGAHVRADVRQQNELFARHFSQLVGDANRVVLCDTGLYGSTQRMLAAGYPALALETVQLARSNYKGHGEEHFPRVAGLLVERTGYSPLEVRSSVLRYWHLVESLFEPAVPSVRLFSEDAAGTVTANCGDIAFGALDPSQGNPLLAGALAYIRELPAGAELTLRRDAEAAWRQLKRAITQPTDADVRSLAVGQRSVDFGRAAMVKGLSKPPSSGLRSRVQDVKSQLWREGAIALHFPVLKHALLPLLGSVQSVRGMRQRPRSE